VAQRGEATSQFQEGLRLLRTGDPEGAALAFRQALDANPGYFDAAIHLGHAFAASRVWTCAVDAYRQALVIESSHPRALVAVGDALSECACYDEALESYDRALQLDATSQAAWLGRGRALRHLNDTEAAITAYRQAASLNPGDLRALRGLASVLEAANRHAEVIELWSGVLERQPESAIAQRGREAAEAALASAPPPPAPATAPLRRDEVERLILWAYALSRDARAEDALAVLGRVLALRPRSWEAHRERGRLLILTQRLEEAIAAFQLALRFEPGDAASSAGLAHALTDLGRVDEALAAYDRALKSAPDNVAVMTARADLLRKQQRLDEALEGFEAALTLDPHHVDSLVGRASTLAALDRFVDALPIWRRVLRIAPDHPVALRGLKRAERELEERGDDASDRKHRAVARVHFDIGKSYLQQSRYADAILSFRRASEVRRDWAEPIFYAGIAHARAGDHRRALRAFEKALERDPQHVEAACHKGDRHREEGEHVEAMESYDIALKHAPELVHAIAGRAEAARMLGRTREAWSGFEHALRLDPRDFVSLCGMAALLNSEKRYDEARPLWERARGVRPRSPFVLKGLAQTEAGATPAVINEPVPPPPSSTQEDRQAKARQLACDEIDRGRSFFKERNYSAAIAAFRKALEVDPTFGEAALRLGMAYEDDRQFRRAIAAYETCVDIEPGHFQAATNIGEAYRKNESYAEAIAAYDRALAIKPDYLYALAGRAECLRMLGRYQEGLEWFDKAIAVGPNHAFAIQGKAAALNAVQRYSKALVWWNKALEMEPQSAFAQDGKNYCEAQIKRPDVPTEDDATPAARGGTPTIDEQGRDLTALAISGGLPQVIGRDHEIRAVMKTLVRRLKANPLLLGEPGVGKTAVVEGVAQRLVGTDVPARLRGCRIVELSMGTLVAGTKYRGTFEERLREIVKEAKASPGLILFIDEIHTLVGAGRTEGGSLDAANILKPALARGEITVIGATTHAEYRRHFESDSALERRFQPIVVEEPSESETVELLSRVKTDYETHHTVKVMPSAVEACVRMSIRFVPDRRLPDKALDLLDEACAEASLSGQRVVDGATVALVVSDRTGVPVTQLTEADRARVAGIEPALRERVVGQESAVSRVGAAVRMAMAGLRSQGRPRGVFLFRGGSGVGKTELAKALADFLFPEGETIIRLDMSEYSDRFTTTRLLGAPPGYAGHGDEGQLTGPLRRHPYSVVLLDEFEKAHPDVQAVFLSLLDEGYITDSDGRHVNAREAFFVLTTNAGSDVNVSRRRSRVGFATAPIDDRERAMEELKPYFRPELLNRLDEIVEFSPLDEEALTLIATKRLVDLADRAKLAGIRLAWTAEVAPALARRAASDREGARPLLRAVDAAVGEPLGRLLLSEGRDLSAARWLATVNDGQVVLVQEADPRVPVQAR
jgi:ATP-dependent Clp protease ATP-binding subunit ClpC